MIELEDAGEALAGGEGAAGAANADAVGLALGDAARGSKLSPEAAEFLAEQTGLIRIQKEHLHEQRELLLSRLRWGRFSDRVKAGLQVMAALVAVALIGVVAVMAWQAHEDHGLVIEAFSVPPDLAQRGLTGQVVATQFLDQLSAMQSQTDSARPARSYQNDWSGDVKVEIPDTGVSLGEVGRWLRQWLGAETHVSGEIYRTPAGLTVQVRSGQDGAASFTTPDDDVGKLLQQAARAVYQRGQPYRYALWLLEQGHEAEGLAALTALADGPDGPDRAWADGIALITITRGDLGGGLARAEDALRLMPGEPYPSELMWSVDALLDRQERALAEAQHTDALQRRNPGAFTPNADRVLLTEHLAAIAEYQGDFRQAGILEAGVARLPDYQGSLLSARQQIVLDAGMDHDGAAADAAYARARTAKAGEPWLLLTTLQAEGALERWPAALQTGAALQAADTGGAVIEINGLDPQVRRVAAAWLAYARAMTGDAAGAQALIATMPLDCYTCLRMRGRIAAAAHDWPAAQRWFAEAVRQGPSLPAAYADWGAMLLARGDPDGAIARLALAHRKGPDYADALELWGEALMRKGDFPGAVARFQAANADAPNWGRNHLRWGQALAAAGRRAEAEAQWRATGGMELSAADRAALARLPGSG